MPQIWCPFDVYVKIYKLDVAHPYESRRALEMRAAIFALHLASSGHRSENYCFASLRGTGSEAGF